MAYFKNSTRKRRISFFLHEIDIKVVFCGEKWWKGRRKKMFMGEYEHSLDAKGRLFLPAKFREQLGECFVITKGLDECLFIYTQNEWKLMAEKLREKKMSRYQLAKEVSVSYYTIRNIEDCEDCLRSTMARIAKVLDMSIMIL